MERKEKTSEEKKSNVVDTTGKSKILRSFSKPAKESDIKFATKQPKEVVKKITPSETSKEESLF